MVSDVYKVRIHKNNHASSEHEYEEFALKILKSDDATDFEFEQELYALKKVSFEPHILEPRTAFKHGDRPCLLFKWAQEGSSSELMKTNPY
ncbi:Ff.00g053540.m01.CDS01 [Fusarium sp. VM40]|nr:Ff.00g053540.m01.CDS01 [Fusarium sp. VM40]